jgi:hypothetical protein
LGLWPSPARIGAEVIVLRQKWSRGQVEARLANLTPCLIGMEARVGAHHLSRRLRLLGHNAQLMPAKYVRPYSMRADIHDGPERNTLQLEAGYIDARPLTPGRRIFLLRTAGP